MNPNLKQIVKDNGFTQTSLAVYLGCGQSQVNHFLNGRKNLSLEKLVKLSEVLNMTLDEIVIPKI